MGNALSGSGPVGARHDPTRPRVSLSGTKRLKEEKCKKENVKRKEERGKREKRKYIYIYILKPKGFPAMSILEVHGIRVGCGVYVITSLKLNLLHATGSMLWLHAAVAPRPDRFFNITDTCPSST